ncbi:hypothetical protein OG520_19430 [Streptomyces sp. NBC_00984]|uniref:hypothetical protein n=1 Tax=Streptomyces sp. NBC_00984 TaxID=2903700 RepID=UPI003869D47F|nr:hypothetical protein OG520_19430 [Streptomyces sp. NBC_00984]
MGSESREGIYGAYADCYRENLDRIRGAYIDVALTEALDDRETKSGLAALRADWRPPEEKLAPLEDAVTGEGPDAVSESAQAASSALVRYGALVLEAIKVEAARRERCVQDAKNAYGATYKAYVGFLYSAAEVLGQADFLRSRS